ncbi:MAG: hypothetical protein HY718_18425 [Planctomycetes bacterium]|nr:hypothetical protein [Planctomycetota bacterium]
MNHPRPRCPTTTTVAAVSVMLLSSILLLAQGEAEGGQGCPPPKTVVSVASGAAASTASGPAAAGPPISGEPYELGGRRLVFTSWQYVRPGSFAWLDEKGNNVSVVGTQGPTEARFRRADYPHGIRLVTQSAQREGPIVANDRPDESKGITFTTLLKDGDTYKAWATAAGEKASSLVYLESKDGRQWTRPDVRFELNGRPDTSLNLGEGTVFIDPSAPPAERFKCVTLHRMSYDEFEEFKRRHPDRWEPRAKREDVGQVFYVQGLVSPDGLKWTSLPEPLSVEHSDTQIVGCYDPQLRKYVIYTRNWMVSPKSPRAREEWGKAWYSVGRRSIGRTESDDFRRFPLSQMILVPPLDLPPSDVLYTNCKTTIPDCPISHVMFPTVWHTADDSTSVVMAASPDGRAWDFVPGGAVFNTPAFGEWDGGCVFARPNLVELPDGSFVLPYTGYLVPHKYPRGQIRFGTGYLVWPKGRLVALEAAELGEFATIAFMPPGRRLLVNAVTTRAGSLRIEVADINGAPLPGRSFAEADPIFGDQYRTPAAWKGQADLGFEDGTPVILRFHLDRAKIFGLDFE